MAKSLRKIRLNLSNGDTVVVQSKTCSERYIRKLIADMEWLTGKVIGWEVL